MKSGNTAVVRAVNDYFDRMQKLSDDPYFETRQREERFIEQIVTEVGKAFTAEILCKSDARSQCRLPYADTAGYFFRSNGKKQHRR